MDYIGIGLVGFGMIGKVHALAYREIPYYYPDALPPIHLSAVCTSRPDSAQAAARQGGFDAWCVRIEDLVARDDVHIVDICTPNFSHQPMILAALAAGKHVVVDKPLALDTRQAREIENAARAQGKQVGLVFNYRFVPAIMRARQLLEEGFLGRIYHFHMEYLHTGYQNPNRPMSWRLRRAQSGGGALMDLGSHVIDMARYLLGDVARVSAQVRTFIETRPSSPGSATREQVDVDDAAWLQVEMKNGAFGTLFVTRFATGAVDDMNVHIYGERGALKFSLQDANVLQLFDASAPEEPLGGRQGWTRIGTYSRYPGAVVPPARGILGWNRTHSQNLFAFLDALVQDKAVVPGVEDGRRVHEVIDAAYDSAQSGRPVQVRESVD